MLTYDAWKLASPEDESDAVGIEEGQICGRYVDPDEDAPRGYKPKPCKGEMIFASDGTGDRWVECDTCGALVETWQALGME